MKLLTKLLLFFIPLTLFLISAAVITSRTGMHSILVEELHKRGLAQVSGDMQKFSKAFGSGTLAGVTVNLSMSPWRMSTL